MRRPALLAGVLAVAVGPVGCGTSSPAAPSPPESVLITGRVLDARDVPVAGARVTATDRFRGAIESLSDAAGGFTLTIDVRNGSFPVVVEKDGFEPSRYVSLPDAPLSRALPMDLRLHAITRILAGDSIRLEVRREDPVCASGPSGLETYPCRRVRIASPAGGQLSVQAVDDLGDFSAVHSIVVQQADKPPAAAGLVIAVPAGSETIVEFMLQGRASQASQSLLVVSWLEPS